MKAKQQYQPKTGQPCHCKPGQQRDNCPDCEGTGQRVDFAAIRARKTFYFEGIGRKVGAIGITHPFTAQRTARNMAMAIVALYDEYEHISLTYQGDQPKAPQ